MRLTGGSGGKWKSFLSMKKMRLGMRELVKDID
jgi:hypothetical protein